MKVCSKCGESKEKDLFHKDKHKSDGLYSSCKDCLTAIYTSKEYREKRKTPAYDAIKRKHKVKSYGLTVEKYDEMIENQGNRCAICDVHQDDLKKLLSVDHIHGNGKVRGLLCGNCNRGLGFFKDSPKLLEKAIEYVVKNS